MAAVVRSDADGRIARSPLPPPGPSSHHPRADATLVGVGTLRAPLAAHQQSMVGAGLAPAVAGGSGLVGELPLVALHHLLDRGHVRSARCRAAPARRAPCCEGRHPWPWNSGIT